MRPHLIFHYAKMRDVIRKMFLKVIKMINLLSLLDDIAATMDDVAVMTKVA